MARVRGSPRVAARHTGLQWQRGYQYANPNRFRYTIDSWRRVATDALGTFVETDELFDLVGGHIDEHGRIEFPFVRLQSVFTGPGPSSDILALGFELGTTLFVIYKNSSDELAIIRNTSGGPGTYTHTGSSITGATRATYARWGNFLYITTDVDATNVYKFRLSDNTFQADVTTMPAGAAQFLIVDNNFIAVENDSATGAINVKWSVDSSPEDFTSTGSGSSLRYNMSTPLSGAVEVDNTAIIIGRAKGIRMIPTGVASPAFRFQDEPAILGGMLTAPTGVARKDSTVFYVDSSNSLMAFRGGAARKLHDTRSDIFNDDGLIYYSKVLDLVLFQHSKATKPALLIDPDRATVVGTFSPDAADRARHMVDMPFLTGSPSTVGCAFVYDFNPTTHQLVWISTTEQATSTNYPIARFDTGYIDLGVDVHVEFVEVESESTLPHSLSPMIHQTKVHVLDEQGDETIIAFSATDNTPTDVGGTRRYPVKVGGRWVRLAYNVNSTLSVNWSTINSISIIGQLQKDVDAGATR